MVDISSERETGSGPATQQHEWSPRHLIWLAAAVATMFCVVFWAALGRPPLSGTKIIAVLTRLRFLDRRARGQIAISLLRFRIRQRICLL